MTTYYTTNDLLFRRTRIAQCLTDQIDDITNHCFYGELLCCEELTELEYVSASLEFISCYTPVTIEITFDVPSALGFSITVGDTVTDTTGGGTGTVTVVDTDTITIEVTIEGIWLDGDSVTFTGGSTTIESDPVEETDDGIVNCLTEAQLDNIFNNIADITGLCFPDKGATFSNTVWSAQEEYLTDENGDFITIESEEIIITTG